MSQVHCPEISNLQRYIFSGGGQHLGVIIVSVCFSLLIPQGLVAQTDPVFQPISPDIIQLSSMMLGENRKVYIYVPPADTLLPDKHYPVLYLLDGDNHFSLIAPTNASGYVWCIYSNSSILLVGSGIFASAR
ncbi:hypothetical protein [Chitinophaga dinghuensis]|uniref:hypothetical protein n=1 Tax=Chitinophaga dinghuensis TaxID=1539050 RepID=UPI0011B948BE|nr:hypothetical protein [Chitinophaga dinghuensis]